MAVTLQQNIQKVMGYMNSGQFSAAAKAAKAAMRKFPAEANFANMVGMATAQGGNPRDAISYFSKALKMRPSDQDMQNNLIQALVMSDQHPKANELIDKLVPKRSDPSPLLQLRAISFVRRGMPHEAIQASSDVIKANPKMALAYTLRGISYTDLGQDADAVADFETAHKLAPNDPDPLANMGLPLSRMGRHDDAMLAVEKALTMRPNHANALHRYAVQLTESGRMPEAIAAYHRLLQVDPLHGEGFSELVKTQSAEENLKLMPALKSALAKVPKKAPAQVFLNLAMGNLLFQQKEHDKAAAYLKTSNKLEAPRRPYDHEAAISEFEHIKALFPVGSDQPENSSHLDPRPIFVIGQPRSGTTLSEMILSAHASVESLGELPFAGRLASAALETNTFDPAGFATEFREALPELPQGTTAFVDKMPANYRYVGFLLQAFPNAKIIHIDRDPRDVALSMWRVNFPSGWMNFSYDLKAMAENANLYRKYMAHWSEVYGDRILTMAYQDIVNDVEAASRKMAAFCDLEWQADMAAPERNTATVRTASVVQVREGVHKKSLGGWRVMEHTLQPFIDGLDPALWPDLK